MTVSENNLKGPSEWTVQELLSVITVFLTALLDYFFLVLFF